LLRDPDFNIGRVVCGSTVRFRLAEVGCRKRGDGFWVVVDSRRDEEDERRDPDPGVSDRW
jgi:predicted nucleic acid-binding Zn ribbon protein